MSISVVGEDDVPHIGALNRLSEVLDIKSSAGSTFHVPIVMLFDYDAIGLAAGERPVMKYYNEKQERWIYVGGEVNEDGKIVIEIDHFTLFAVTSMQPIPFSDLAEGHWARAYVDRLAGMGVIDGQGDGTFAPNESVTRAQFAKMIVEALGMKSEGMLTGFADGALISSWARSYVSAAEQAGFIQGYEKNGARWFRPNQTITRAEMAVMIANAAGLASMSSAVFSDQQNIPGWAQTAVQSASASGIISGYP